MGTVEAIIFSDNLAQLNDLLGGGQRAGGVNQTRGQAESAGFHTLTDDILLCLVGIALCITHNGRADDTLSNIGGQVDSNGGVVHQIHILREGHGAQQFSLLFIAGKTDLTADHAIRFLLDGGEGKATASANLRRDTLKKLVSGVGVCQNVEVAMGVVIDKARANN